MNLPIQPSYKHFAVTPKFSALQFVDEYDRARQGAASPFAYVLIQRNRELSLGDLEFLPLSSSNVRPLTPLKPDDYISIFASSLGLKDPASSPVAFSPAMGGGGAFFTRAAAKDSTEEFLEQSGPSVIAKPTNKGLMLLCAHYFKKYGIDITVTGSYETFTEALKAPLYNPKAKAWGIIATNGDAMRSHVTPVICFQKDPSAQVEILMLDSLESPILAVAETLRAMKRENPEARIYDVRGARQIDSYGCRTDAFCVLKDALRILNHAEIDDLASYLKLRTDYGPRYSFYLPAAWAKSAQITEHIKDPLSTPVLSKSAATFGEFIAKFTKTPDSPICLELPTSHFLSFKGKKLVQKIPLILSENNSDLRRRLRLLEAFYLGPQPKTAKGE